jgi:hypothetical protein
MRPQPRRDANEKAEQDSRRARNLYQGKNWGHLRRADRYGQPDGDSWKVKLLQEVSADDPDRREMIEQIAACLKAAYDWKVDAATRVVNSGYRKDNANINFEDFGNHSRLTPDRSNQSKILVEQM